MHASNLYRPFATAEIDKMIYRFKTFKFKVFIDKKKTCLNSALCYICTTFVNILYYILLEFRLRNC